VTASPSDAEAWDRYWAYGNLHSFSQVAPGNYGGRVGAFWHGVFAGRADGDRVLDIATGNGAIPLLAQAAAAAAGRRLELHGTDLAAIDPPRQVGDPALREPLAAIRFHARTPAEALPFDAAAFDCVTSQFGLEYSDLARSVPEAARVLRAGGELALVMHHDESAVVVAARAEARQLDFVLDSARVFSRARDLLRARAEVPAARRGAKPPVRVRRRQADLERAIERVERAAADADGERMLLGPLNYVREVLAVAERSGPGEALDWLAEARRRVRATRDRLAAMQAAARTDADMAALADQLAAAGFARPRIERLDEADGAIVGWQLLAARRSTAG